MMHKVVLQAPPGYTGEVHAGHSKSSLKNYTLDEKGRVTVDHVDATPLIAAGWIVIGHSDVIEPLHRPDGAREFVPGSAQQNEDFGKAIPPHGLPVEGTGSDAGRASAEAEVVASERAGMDLAHRSAQTDTGGMDAVKQAGPDQDAVRGEKPSSDHHDAAFGEFKDHAGQEGGEPPTIRGKTQDEVEKA